MSTEKLSELSNNARKAANSFYNWSQLANCTYERVSCLTVERLKETSELFSALLAELEAKDKCIAEAEVRGVEKLAAAFKSWASDETFPDCEAQRHWATASQEALSFAGDLRNGSCDDR